MKVADAIKTFRDQQADARFLRFGIAGSLLLNMGLGFALIMQPETVVLVPPYTYDEIRFVEGKANQEYYRSWAWSNAMLLGNLDPSNVEFVRGELQRIASTRLYSEIEAKISAEMENISRDKAVIQFSPRTITYDPNLDLYFVSGRQTLGGPAGKAIGAKQITYEMGFRTVRNRIFLDEFRVYDGAPLTNDIRQDRLRQIEEQRLDAEREAEARKS
ncbi:MAG: hypothetical protein DI556_13435 [Rhodovulum sulfidophilum]|uniref:Uncharacterized protein n=1 Tax=Rhodovulum sulfidophilum TaxID=35806 RepID=A0A2W5N5S3_RHOSU|nr:MAG: hypothetical protein DI556_13435 [Rhodovulum sulfidophilum]